MAECDLAMERQNIEARAPFTWHRSWKAELHCRTSHGGWKHQRLDGIARQRDSEREQKGSISGFCGLLEGVKAGVSEERKGRGGLRSRFATSRCKPLLSLIRESSAHSRRCTQCKGRDGSM